MADKRCDEHFGILVPITKVLSVFIPHDAKDIDAAIELCKQLLPLVMSTDYDVELQELETKIMGAIDYD